MSAIFSLDVAQEPQYIDLLDVAAGYGSLSVPVENFFPGDVVDAMFLTIEGMGLTTITAAIDQVQRTQGYFEWTSSSSISGHFTLTTAQTALIAAATDCTYAIQIQITRSGNSYQREVQSGNINVRPSIPSPPLIVSSIAISGGPVTGNIGTTAQLVAVAYDSYGNVVPGVSVAWSSTDEDVATVDANGLVTITGLGGAVIEVTTYGVSATTLANGTVMPFGVGSLLYADTLSTMAFLPIGTPFQHLRVNAGATAPEWDTLTAADIAAGTFQSGTFTFGGNVLFSGDNTYDLGASGATRPRDLYLGRNMVVGGTTTLGGIAYTWPGSQSANKVLKTDGAGALSWSTPTEEIALTDLTDVTISGVQNGQVLQYSSGSSLWVNTFDASLLTALNATQLTSGTVPNGRLTGIYSGVTGLGTLAADLLFTDATYDIGKSGATRPRDGFFSRNVAIGGTLGVTGTSTLGVVGAGATTVTTLHASSTSALDGDVTTLATFIGALSKTLTFGTHLAAGGSSFNNAADVTISTDATALNTASTIVARDGSGNFAAGTITATVTGHSSLDLALTGGTMAGNILFTDNLYDIGASGLTRPRSGYFATNVTVGGVFIGNLTNTLTFGTHLVSGGSSFNNSASVTISTDATSANTASTIVARDGSGNFTAGTVTATLSGAAPAGSLSGSTLAAGVTASSLTSFGTLAADLLFVDATYDIGKTGATRPRDLFLSRNLVVGGTLNVTGATTLGAIAGLGTISSDLLFTDATYDIGKSGATRPRDLFISRNFTAGGTGHIVGATTLDSTLSIGGNVISDVLFTDATYDIGKSGATRPRDGFFSRNFVIGGTLGVTGNVTFSGTGNSVGTITTGVWQGTTVAVGFGGTGIASYTIGDIVYASASTTISKLGIGTAAQILIVNGAATAPQWHTLVTADVTDIATASTGITKVGALAVGSIASGFGGATFGGNVIAGTDATYDLGASGANRFRDFFLSRNATIGGTLNAAGVKITGGTQVTGEIYKDATRGLSLVGIAGSAQDFSIFTPGGGLLFYNDTGTNNLAMAGQLTITGALGGVTSLVTTGAASLSTTTGVVSVGLVASNFATSTGFSKIGLGGNGTFYSGTTIQASQPTAWTQNGDLNTAGNGVNYISTDLASRIYQLGGTIHFQTAPSGTAGNPITFVDSLVLNADQSVTVTTGVLKAGGSNTDLTLSAVGAGGNLILKTNGASRIGVDPSGNVQFNHYGAGTATFDASGNVTSVSDPSQKIILGGFAPGMAEIRAIATDRFMGLHRWTKESGMETVGVYASFFARDDFPIPDAIHKGTNGINSFSDRPVLMATVNAVNEIADILDADDKRLIELESFRDRAIQKYPDLAA